MTVYPTKRTNSVKLGGEFWEYSPSRKLIKLIKLQM